MMHRLVAAATIALFGAVITVSPALAADIAGTQPPAVPSSSTPVSSTPVSSAPVSSTAVSSTTTSSTSVPPAATARAAQPAAVNIIANAATCAYFCFSPDNATIAVGGTVTWTNKTSNEHVVARCTPADCDGVSGGTGTDANFGAAQIALPAGKSFRYTFSEPGTYVYYCPIHGYAIMHGTITVTDAAPTTTVAPATTTPAITVANPVVPTVPPDPRQLAHTGSRTTDALAVAVILVVVGLTAASFRLRRRHTEL